MGEVASGRPVNAEAGKALKAAALQLVRANGYDNVSIAAIAKAAGVARQTLYNRWATKADLILEAVFEETHNYAAEPDFDTDKDCRTLLETFLVNVFNHLEIDGDTLRALIAAAQHDTNFQASFYSSFVKPRERLITDLLVRSQTNGELPSHRNPETVSAMIHGAFWYRLLNRGALNPAFAREIVSNIFD